jgi:hypothetical protein
MSGTLFVETRQCICCDRTATPLKRKPGEPNVMAVSMTIYRHGTGKGVLRAARRVQVCEECFIKALASSMFGMSKEARDLLAGLRQSLSDCYSTLVDDEWDGSAA